MEWRLGAWRGGLGGWVEGERDTISLILWPLRGVACTSCSKPWTCSKEPVACSKPWTCSNEPVAVQSRGPVQMSLLPVQSRGGVQRSCSKPWTCSKEPVACSKPWTCSKEPVAVQSRGPVQRSLLPVQSRAPVQRSLLLFKAVDLFKGASCCSKPWTCSKEPVQSVNHFLVSVMKMRLHLFPLS